MRWKVPMPKEAPKEDHCHVIVAIKGQRTRFELVTQVPTEHAQKVIELMVHSAAHQATKEPK